MLVTTNLEYYIRSIKMFQELRYAVVKIGDGGIPMFGEGEESPFAIFRKKEYAYGYWVANKTIIQSNPENGSIGIVDKDTLDILDVFPALGDEPIITVEYPKKRRKRKKINEATVPEPVVSGEPLLKK